jgi:tetratricopeptide (TPR) repeat protein
MQVQRMNNLGKVSALMERRRWLATASALALTSSILRRPARAQERVDALYVEDDVDRAVKRGVEFLVARQNARDGSIYDRGHGITMTALSVMAMASIGNGPTDDTPVGKAMRAALDFVLLDRHQDARGYFGDQDGSRMYGHGIITLMLTEMLGMGATAEQNAKIHQALVRAIELILLAQAVPKQGKLKGGWRYGPNDADSDLSVSVWQLMALRSAKNDGLDVPGQAIDDAIKYLENSFTEQPGRDNQGESKANGFSYTPGNYHPTFTMTAAGLLAMHVCGQYDSPMVLSAAKWLLEHPPKVSERFFYYGIYYYAQGMYQAAGEYAETAERLTRELLVNEQKGDGSWSARGGEELNHGNVYSTSLAILSLSVRYHYLPIYQR